VNKNLENYAGDDRIISSFEAFEELSKNNIDLNLLKTNMPRLDELTGGGFYKGSIIVVSGVTGEGKTLWCQTLTKNFVDQGIKPLWFEYEVMAIQFLKQFEQPLPYFHMPRMLKNGSISWLFDRIYEAIAKYKIDVVFIDHLHFLADVLQSKNTSLDIGRIMRMLKNLATETATVVFLVAHTHKTEVDTELGIGCTRDSSFIEQDADGVFYIWRRVNTDNRAVLKIAKYRGNDGLAWNKKIQLMKLGKYLVEVKDEPEEVKKARKPKKVYTPGEDDDDESGLFKLLS
jgi:KaiC/GvpD/RAD55 family RecA-like ATPase